MFRPMLLFFIGCFLIAGMSAGQNTIIPVHPPELKKNVVSAAAGGWPMEFYFSLLGNYERLIYQTPRSSFHSIWIRAGAGPWAEFGPTGVNFVSTLSALIGRQSAHLEFGSGVIFTWWSDSKSFHPLVNEKHLAGFLGFRYQKPGGNFVFRTGMGWPEGIFLGLGYCF